jgi:LacI family transcriptional regulator
MKLPKSPTIHDVAKRAGVSLSTVSRVLNDSASVSSQTREKVEAAISELHYEKTRTDNLKHLHETKMAGLIIPDILNPFFPLLMKGIEHVSKIHDYSLILCDSEDNAALEQQHINLLCDRGVDGIIIIPSSGTSHVEKLVKKGFPFVFLDRFIELEEASYVISDNEEGAYQAVKYLLKLGHQRIVMVTGPRDLSTEQARIKGAQRALTEEGVPCLDELLVVGNYRVEDAYQAIVNVLRQRLEFTAIFATNDMMAFGAKKALEEHDLKIPADISLVGYDDILFSSIISLTSVSQPTYEMGKNAMVLLLDLINERITPPQHVMLRPSMVIRSSCQRR